MGRPLDVPLIFGELTSCVLVASYSVLYKLDSSIFKVRVLLVSYFPFMRYFFYVYARWHACKHSTT